MTSNAKLVRDWMDNKRGPEGEKLERTELEWQGLRRDLLAEHEDIQTTIIDTRRGITIVSIGAMLFMVLLIFVATHMDWNSHHALILPIIFVVIGAMGDFIAMARCGMWFADEKGRRKNRRNVQRALDEWDLLYAEHAK